MSSKTINEQLEKTKKKTFWDKRIVLVTEISLCVVSGLLFVLGVILQNALIEGVFSNCFTALLVTVLGTIVSWNTETDVERTIRSVEEQTSKEIAEIQESASAVSDQLRSNLETLHGNLDSLNKSTNNFNNAIDLFNGRACTFCKNYIKDIKFRRSDCDLEGFFKSAKSTINILATNLESFRSYQNLLSELSIKGIDIRIAAMHPNYARDFLKSRIADDKTTLEQRWSDMKQALFEFTVIASRKDGNKLQVHTYSTIAPTLILLMADDECYVAYLLNGRRSRDTIHFRFSGAKESDPFAPVHYFKKHFESVWNDPGTKKCILEEIQSIHYTL